MYILRLYPVPSIRSIGIKRTQVCHCTYARPVRGLNVYDYSYWFMRSRIKNKQYRVCVLRCEMCNLHAQLISSSMVTIRNM